MNFFVYDSIKVTVMLAVIVLIIGALTFFPALSLGPVVEHLLMLAGRSF